MAAVKEHMRRQGIILNSNWLTASIERIRQENRGVTHSAAKMNELVYTRWLHSDINDSCTPTLPHSILQQASGTLTGSYIVQVQSVINVGSSAYGQLMKIKGREAEEIEVTPHADNVKPTRMMYLSLTDGGVACNGMEYSPIRCINNKLPPGIKLCLNGPIRYRLGTLLLAEDNVNVLGGCVEELMRINTEEKMLARTLNREDLITEEGGVGGASDTESVQLLSISQLTDNQLPPIVYVKATIMRLTGPLSPNEGVWSLEATIADGTGTIPVLLGNGPLEILIGFTANEYHQIPRTQGEEALRKCQEILSRLYCVMELTISSRNNKPTVTRLLDV